MVQFGIGVDVQGVVVCKEIMQPPRRADLTMIPVLFTLV